MINFTRRILKIFLLLFASLITIESSYSQNTVGLLDLEVELYDPGYNLLFPHNQSTVFLINECGEVVHEWTDSVDFRPGNGVYLTENGDIIKCKRSKTSAVNDPIWAGGGGESVEIRNWDNELLSSFTLNDSLFRLHHDVAPMPNGNILMIVWEAISGEDAIDNGRDPSLLDSDKVWSLAIFEWDPSIDTIVWEWHAWDHLVQDFDPSMSNYGVVHDSPHKINVNYALNGHPDWLHTNSIDYNPVLDQIALSVPHFDELWIIDHSTTTEEASSSIGGNAGKGGDLLYRWGNPLAYNKGDTTSQKLYFQHDVHWIDPMATEGDDDFGKLLLFNNRLPNDLSSTNIIQTAVSDFNYSLEDGVFLPSDFERTVFHPSSSEFSHSVSVSSAQMLPNDNLLILSGRWGYAYELTPDNELAWEYRIPLKGGSPVTQGDTLAIGNNFTFRMKRYPLDFPAFEGKELAPKGYIELMPDTSFCNSLIDVSIPQMNHTEDVVIFPNPATDFLNVEVSDLTNLEYQIYNIQGKTVLHGSLDLVNHRIDIKSLFSGIYFIRIGNQNYKFIKE